MSTLKLDLNNLNVNFEKLLFYIGLTKKDVYELCKIKDTGKFTSLCFLDVQKILEKLNFDLRELGKNRICPQTLKKQLEGDSIAIKKEFIGNKGSRIKTIESALSLVDKESRKRVLRKHQIKEEVFEGSSRLVSAELLKSIFQDLTQFSYAKEADIVGHVNCRNFLESNFKSELKKFKSPADAYVYFIEYCTSIVEKNMDYKIVSASPSRVVFKYETKESVKDYFSVKHFGNQSFCQNIQGFFEELVKYRYTYPATVRKLSCTHLGQSSCTYEIIFDGIVTH